MSTVTSNKTDLKSAIKILVVDDREDNLFSLEAILEREEYTIVKANSGKAALKILLSDQDFSLILMDVQMPDLNGFETATIIYERDKLKSIPIIFITAYGKDEEHVYKGYQMGGVDYIYKPVNADLLRTKVSVFVELFRKNHLLQLQEKKLLQSNKSLNREIEEKRISEEKIKQLNEQLTKNNAHLKQMNEELDQFAFMASHDLQEPLRKIQMFSDKILLKKNQDEETEKYFSKIISASKRMQSLINNLLDFSRHSTSSSDFKKTDIRQLFSETLIELETLIEKSGATINYDNLPVIKAVPGLIQQLFYNLVNNAIKFRRIDVPLVIDVHSEKISPQEAEQYVSIANGDVFYKITIADNGIGFDNKHSVDIFKVFKRLHSYQEYEGTGVGLSICKKIVEKHGGFIKAESGEGRGATFTIIIPETPVAANRKAVETSEP